MTALGRSPRDGIVRARRAGKSTSADPRNSTGVLSIPTHMMRQLPENATFRAEWHEDGILYRYLPDGEPHYDDGAPAWVRHD